MMKKTLLAAAVGMSGCFWDGCIAVGSAVLTPRGRKPIESLAPGDEVTCLDPVTGERVTSTVAATRRVRRETVRLAGDGWALRCTSDHPLYDPTTREWSAAGDWVLGKRTTLLLVGDGAEVPRQVVVRERLVNAGLADLVDLSVVHTLHNFVAEGILVHNKPPIAMTCVLPGSSARQTDGSSCTCLDGSEGFVNCAYDSTAGQCVNCASPINSDGGSDGGLSGDGGTDGGSDGG